MILSHTESLMIHMSDLLLVICVSLVRTLEIPFHRQRVVLIHTEATLMQPTEIALGGSVTLVSCLEIILRCSAKVLIPWIR